MIKFKLILASLACLMIINTGHAQEVKVGYTNVELVLAYMPQAQQMEQSLAAYQKSLAEKISTKQNFLQSKYDEYIRLKESNSLSPQDAAQRESEMQRLDQEVQKQAAESEQQLLAKRQE